MGELLRSPGLGPVVDAIQARLAGSYRILGMLPWGQTVPYFRAEGERGEVVLAALPVDCDADPETEAAFICATFDLDGLAGPGLPELVDHAVASGMPYLVYGVPSGELLSSRLTKGALASRTLLEVAEQLLDGLAVVHRHGMVHGELSPENILIDDDGAQITVTLLGAGLIPLVHEARARAHERSSGPAPSGSAYRAPELLAGGSPTEGSDLYAMGALLHHMVTGHPPEGWDSAAPFADVPALPDVIRRAMARDPERRYPNVAALRAALDWVEVESEKMNAHTQDIPLWMEHSIVGSIPVPELLRSTSSIPPPRPSSAPPSGRVTLSSALPSLTAPSGPGLGVSRAQPHGDEAIEEEITRPSAHRAPARGAIEQLPPWAQAALATAFVVAVGTLTWLLTG